MVCNVLVTQPTPSSDSLILFYIHLRLGVLPLRIVFNIQIYISSNEATCEPLEKPSIEDYMDPFSSIGGAYSGLYISVNTTSWSL